MMSPTENVLKIPLSLKSKKSLGETDVVKHWFEFLSETQFIVPSEETVLTDATAVGFVSFQRF
jgi:hypothetical protein